MQSDYILADEIKGTLQFMILNYIIRKRKHKVLSQFYTSVVVYVHVYIVTFYTKRSKRNISSDDGTSLTV